MSAEILNLNREGIRMFDEGSFGAALNAFCRSLKLCDSALKSNSSKKLCSGKRKKKKKSVPANKDSVSPHCIDKSAVGIVVPDERSSIDDNMDKVAATPLSEASKSTSESSTQENPILLVPLSSPFIFIDGDKSIFGDIDDPVENEEQYLVLSMTSIFNIALTSHAMLLSDKMLGKRCRTTTGLRMKALLELYECAYLMLMKVEKKKRTKKSQLFIVWSRMLMFSILHGMGSINRDFRTSGEWLDCFDCIFSLYVCLEDQGIRETEFPPYFNLDVIIFDVLKTLRILDDRMCAPAA
jgi:hypothetical protein